MVGEELLGVYRNLHPRLLSGDRPEEGAGRGHRERVEPFDTSGALGTGRWVVDAPGREQRGCVCPDLSARKSVVHVGLSDSGPLVTDPWDG